jgi:hypothetical protein
VVYLAMNAMYVYALPINAMSGVLAIDASIGSPLWNAGGAHDYSNPFGCSPWLGKSDAAGRP